MGRLWLIGKKLLSQCDVFCYLARRYLKLSQTKLFNTNTPDIHKSQTKKERKNVVLNMLPLISSNEVQKIALLKKKKTINEPYFS